MPLTSIRQDQDDNSLHALWFPHPWLWAGIALQWLTIAFLSWHEKFTIHPMQGWPTQALFIAVMLAAAVLARHRWPDVTRALFGISGFYIFGLGTVAQSYLVTSSGAQFALADPYLAQADKALGFDWVAHVAWVNGHPMVRGLLDWGYGQIAYSFIFAAATLMAARKFRRLAEVFIILFIGNQIMISMVWLWPAIGPYTHLAPDPASISHMPSWAGRYSLAHFTALRAHLMTSVTLGKTTGLITFPSFHATAAIITTWAVWRRGMFWPLLVMNSVMLVSTISMGGHYLIDLIASFVIFVSLAVLVRRLDLSAANRAKVRDRMSAPVQPALRPSRPD